MPATVVIDPGHGGSVAAGGSSANNAVGLYGLLEKDLTLDIGRRVAALLGNRATVLLTRSVDENRSLSDRAKIARDANADVFLSIHLNGWKEGGVDGSEAWVAKRAGAGSRALARSVLDRVLGVTHARDRGVQEQDFGVLLPERQGSHTAASLLEVAFLTNPDEAERFTRDDYKQVLAIAIADGIASQLQTNGTAAALATTAQQEAIDALNAFRAETTAGSFTPTRVDVADRAIALVNDPTLVEQGGLGLCGPAAVHRLWIKRDPKAFAAYITSLYDTGSGTFGDRTISAGADLRNQDYYGRAVPAMEALAKNPQDKVENVCPSADWVAMSSLRDASNIFLDFEGMPDEDYAVGTSASEVAAWLRSTGAYASVSEEGNFFFTKGLAHAEGLHPGPDTDVVLLINAHILTADAIVKGKTKSDDFIGSAFPNHVVVLESDVTEPTPDEVEFTCFTWGGTMHVRLRKEIFEANYYGAIVAHVPAPAPTSLALAAGAAPARIDGIDCDSRNRLPSWDDLRADGIQFGIFKATEGTTYVDDGTGPDSVPNASFADRRRSARAANFLVGSYHYGRAAGNLADAPDLFRRQADNMIATVERVVPGELPPSYDFEEHLNTGAVPWRGAQWLEPMEAFLDRVETALGRVPMIYTSLRIWRDFLNNDPAFSRFNDYPLWDVFWLSDVTRRYPDRLTRRPPLPAAWTDWTILQYSGDYTPTECRNLRAMAKKMDMDVSNGGIHVVRGLADLGRPALHGDSVRFVAYTDENGNLMVLTNLGQWLELSITDNAQGLRASGDVAACEIGDRQFYAFRGRDDGHLYEIERSGPQFTVTDLSATVIGGDADPHYLRPVSDPSYVVNGSDRAIAYWGENNHQYLVQNTVGTWQALDATTNPGAEDAAGNATLYVSNGTVHVVGRAGRDGHLVDAQYGNFTWNLVDLTAGSSAPAATYKPATYPGSDGATRIVYRALRGDIHQVDGQGTTDENLSQLAGGAPTSAGSPAAFVFQGVPHIVYRGIDGAINEIVGDGAGGFTHGSLPCDVPAAADPAVSVGSANGEPAAFVVFRGRDEAFHEARRTAAAWSCRPIDTVSQAPTAELGLEARALAAPPTPVVTAADSALVRADRVIPATACGVLRDGDGNYRERTPEKIVIHVLDDAGGYAHDIASWQAGRSCTPPHYVIRNDGEITQMVAEKYMAQHAGPAGNPTMIGIEHDGWDNDPAYFTEAMYGASAALVRDICGRNGIPVDREHVIGHDEVPHAPGKEDHGDPGGYWDWDYYMALVRWDGVDATRKPLRFVVDATALSGSMASPAWRSVDRDSGREDWRGDRISMGPFYYSAYGPRYVRAQGAPDAPVDDGVEFRFVAPQAGSWAVSAWWPVLDNANSATRFEISVPTSSDPGQQHTLEVDQSARWMRTRPTVALPLSPTWCPLPMLELQQNDEVKVRVLRRSDASGTVLADAVRFLRT
jgi:N-acetylmuramoyl-L-alanine amidase/GH25 family lysozyme M1 (1,4-beta-N-acetylmuramidase)